MNKKEQDRLVKDCKKNNRAAMEKIYTFYKPKMIAVSIRYCKNIADAEDIVQEAFIKVFSAIKKYKHKGTLGSWIERIVINGAIDHWHTAKKTIAIEHTEAIEEHTIQEMDRTEKEHFERQLTTEKIRTLILELPEQYRYVLNLYAIEEYSHKEIAAMLHIKESTSRSNYARARKKLLEAMRAIGIHTY